MQFAVAVPGRLPDPPESAVVVFLDGAGALRRFLGFAVSEVYTELGRTSGPEEHVDTGETWGVPTCGGAWCSGCECLADVVFHRRR